MSISGSLYTATTALNAYGNSMSVVGNNIANVNTVGFKASRMEFADLLPSIFGGIEAGHGVRLASVSRPFQQGAIQTTGNVMDLAVSGAGFFTVRDGSGSTFYTRAGEFHIDPSGILVNPLGLFLQGTSGNIALGNGLTMPPQATSSLSLAFNLDASSTPPASVFPAGPDAGPNAWFAASNFSLITPIFDSQGDSHDLTFLFQKSAPNIWDYRVVARRSELDALALTSTDLRQVGAGGLVFDSSGNLNFNLSTISDITGLNWIGGGASQTLSAANLNFSGAVQYSQPATVFSVGKDGSSIGVLHAIAIDEQGFVNGKFSNGANQVLDRITLANFASVEGLDPRGNGLFAATLESGPARVGVPGQNELGTLVSGALEMSTVDLAEEFVSLITSQRAFQMSSRVITVADQMYSEAANLKR